MDRIMARGMTFKACHGVLPFEKSEPQTFRVDVDLLLDTSLAGHSDDIKDTVSYADVFAQVRKIVEQESYQLLEALAENIAAALLLRFPVLGVEITVNKPDAPVEGQFDYFGVSIKRYRN
ncbi:MAG: dihydroneopterin aldolase [Syntrophomonadaceae bacterium]|nr:dihydroneopterin aldolase [Syntrophomonadaceae bacterium]